MAMTAGAKRGKRIKFQEDGEEELVDRISRLPDGVLGDIVSLLPTKDGARTQILSSRWRPIWRSAPLNFDLGYATWMRIGADGVSRILSAHQGPARRFLTHFEFLDRRDHSATLDGWLRSPTLDNLQELKFYLFDLPPLPVSVHRFSSTLCVASIGGCTFPEENSASLLHLPLLKELSLSIVRISETSLHALLAACPALQSLLLTDIVGCSRVQIVSQSLRSIGLCNRSFKHSNLQQLIIKDAPYLERLLCFEDGSGMNITVSVVSPPNLHVVGLVCGNNHTHDIGNTTFRLGNTAFQRSHILSLRTVVHSMKVLALTQQNLCLDMVIDLLKCFPCLEKLYIRTYGVGKKNTWCRKHKNLIGTLEIRLKKIVLTKYRGNTSHVNLAKFFVLNARMLQSLRLELFCQTPSSTWIDETPSSAWIERQHGLLQIKNKASKDAEFDFAFKSHNPGSLELQFAEQVHDFSTDDPFVRFHNWI